MSLALLAALVAPGQSPKLTSTVALAKVADYLDQYQEQIAAVVLEEDYLQRVMHERGGGPPVSRQLRSDVLVMADPIHGWVGFRDVFEVDGRPVRDRDERLAKLFASEQVDPAGQARRLVEESIRFNLNDGDMAVDRSINMPMTALKYLVRENQSRSSFKEPQRKPYEGRTALVVEFRERAKPRIVATDDDAAVEGRVWIEPESGAVMRTELWFDTKLPKEKVPPRADGLSVPITVRTKVRVTFAHNAKLGMWLPVTMEEEYGLGRTTIGGTAHYANPRRFGVGTRLKAKLP